MNDLPSRLRHFINENFLFGTAGDFGDGDSLIEHGIIDSTGVLELIAFLEQEFGVAVGDDELLPENLDSIDNLVSFIGRKRAPALA